MKLIKKTCSERGCKNKFETRPQHVKISVRCFECQRKKDREYQTNLQRERRARRKKQEEEKIIN